jgi:sugar O-acyltransferase (sialic acid O-acetyltransferase NeuD family)
MSQHEKKPEVMVVGAGGHAKVVIDILRAAGFHIAAVFDDAASRRGEIFRGSTIVGSTAEIPAYATQNGLSAFVVAIGDNPTRLALGEKLESVGLHALSAIHPSAVLAPGVHLGGGTVVMAGVCINADAVVGRHSILNTQATIEHDCVLADGVHIAPGATLCGGVQVGRCALVGAAAVIIPLLHIGAHAQIGAGAAVVDAVPEHARVSGVPARRHQE